MNSRRLLAILLGVFILAILFNVMVMRPPGSNVVSPSNRRTAPDIEIPMEPDKPKVSLSSLKGKVVILDFWATWCGPCRESIPELIALDKKFKERGLVIIGIANDRTLEEAEAYAKRIGMTYPVVLDTSIERLREKYVYDAIPQMYIIDKQGRVAKSVTGYNPSQPLEPIIEQFLNE